MQQSNEWGEQIPEPGVMFTNRAINPRNVEVEERRQRSMALSKRKLKWTVRRRDHLYNLLKAVGFWPAYEDFQRLSAHYRNLDEALKGAVNGQREPLELEALETAREIKRLRQAHSEHIEAFREWRALCDRLNEHTYAVLRQNYDQKLKKELEAESEHFEQIIINTWARLGFKHDMLDRRGKRDVHKVSFAEMQIIADQIWYKILTTKKTLFHNFKSALPYNVRVRDLCSDETVFELSMACQRQVTAITNNNGAWVVVNRLDSVDGILSYITYEQVMKHYKQADHPYLPIPIGVALHKKIDWVMLAHYPHFLIGGTTGDGKSNLINVIICTLISQHSPEEIQLILIDLKEGLEFQHYEKVPHLLRDVVTTIPEAAQVMLQIEQLRAERSLQLAEARVKDLDEYNSVMERRGLPRMPRVLVVFDEFAAIDNQFMKDEQKSILASTMQLTNKGRAAGIHLILCTQRPSVDIVPGNIKDNMPFRIAGAMPTQAASSTILGVGDAASLPLVKGRMMAMAGSLKWQIQTPHIQKLDIDLALKKSMKWAEKIDVVAGDKVALPEAKGSLGFGMDDLLIMVMDSYNGELVFKQLWEQLKDMGLVAHNELHRMCKDLKSEPFEYEGVRYKWTTRPGGSVYAEVDDTEEEVVNEA